MFFRFPVVLFISCLLSFYSTNAAPQLPEINDQFEIPETTTSKPIEENTIVYNDEIKVSNNTQRRSGIALNESLTTKIYNTVSIPFQKLISAPKILLVFRNIGTCIVNGALEIVTYYFPAPFIPLIASAAGLIIPFEPVVMLRQKMPVTSYRRAFSTALNSFMHTFDKYKVDEEPDPYMTRRFNRRFMDEDKKKSDDDDDLKL